MMVNRVVGHYVQDISNLIRIVAPLLVIFATMRFSLGFTANAGTIMLFYINIPLFLSGFADIHLRYISFKMVKPYLLKLTEFNDVEPEDEGGPEITAFESLRTDGIKVAFPGGASSPCRILR